MIKVKRIKLLLQCICFILLSLIGKEDIPQALRSIGFAFFLLLVVMVRLLHTKQC